MAGGEAKCRYVIEELGFDACIDYKNENIGKGLSRHCPNGIDVYFDNVGGEILDLCLARIARKARIIICGAISQYNSTTAIEGPKNYLVAARVKCPHGRLRRVQLRQPLRRGHEGHGYMAARRQTEIARGYRAGLETFPETLLKLFTGENFGKLILEIA